MKQDKTSEIEPKTMESILKSMEFKIDPKEALHYLWEDYKMRQAHYWASFNRFGIAIITVLVLPYVKPENMKPFGSSVAIFPIVGLVLSLSSMWLLGAEYQRLYAIKVVYDYFLMGNSELPYRNRIDDHRWYHWYHRLLGKNIGYATTLVFGVGLSFLSVLSWFLLSTQNR